MPTVLIWQNNMLPGGREATSARTGRVVHWPGHASLSIDDSWVGDVLADARANYVSWWPGARRELSRGEKLESKVAGMRVAQGSAKNNLISDLVSEGYLPDNIVRIAATDDQKLAMRAVWAEIRGKENASYRALYKNCSTIVARVLRAGSFRTGLFGFWTDHSVVWTPNKVLKFAQAAGGVAMTWAQLYPELEAVGANYGSWGNQRRARDNRYCSTGVDCVNNYPR